ncbi:hypothetical protein FGD73_22495, partial [Escherichia coli]
FIFSGFFFFVFWFFFLFLFFLLLPSSPLPSSLFISSFSTPLLLHSFSSFLPSSFFPFFPSHPLSFPFSSLFFLGSFWFLSLLSFSFVLLLFSHLPPAFST